MIAVCVLQTNVCKHIDDSRHSHLFASAQCLGYSFEFGQLTDELCLPSKAVIVSQVQRAVQRLGVVVVFVATDRNAMIADFKAVLKPTVRVQSSECINCRKELTVLLFEVMMQKVKRGWGWMGRVSIYLSKGFRGALWAVSGPWLKRSFGTLAHFSLRNASVCSNLVSQINWTTCCCYHCKNCRYDVSPSEYVPVWIATGCLELVVIWNQVRTPIGYHSGNWAWIVCVCMYCVIFHWPALHILLTYLLSLT